MHYGRQSPTPPPPPHPSNGVYPRSTFPSFPSSSDFHRRSFVEHQPPLPDRLSSPPRYPPSTAYSAFPSANRAPRESTPPYAARPRPAHSNPPTYQEVVRDVSPGVYQRSFNQRVLKERSPPSSTALYDLLQRYPSARASVLSRSLSGQLPNEQSLNAGRQEYYIQREDYRSDYGSSSLDRHSGGSYGSSDPYTTPSDFTPSDESPRSSNSGANQDTWTDTYSSTATLKPLDVSILDDLIHDRSPSSTMSRSTNEWRSSFERAQQHFRSRPASPSEGHSVTSTLLLPKSSSATSISERSLLADAVSRADASAASGRKTPQLNEFWSGALARASSPTPPSRRLPAAMTAAERLSMLKESADSLGSGSASATVAAAVPLAPRRTDSIASRQAPFLSSSASAPNFAALDRAVAELPMRSGCARFPTEDHAFSPPPFGRHGGAASFTSHVATTHVRTNGVHSPSPDSLSEASSYGVPSGLPHPKPRHNVMEQLARVSSSSSISSLHNPAPAYRPNFPTTGSVSSRISELEKRPGTPTLRLAGGSVARERDEETPRGPAPLSPRSTVFRTKPVIHVDMGGRVVQQQPMQQQHQNGLHQQHLQQQHHALTAANQQRLQDRNHASATIRGTAYTNYNVKAEEPTATFSFRIQKNSSPASHVSEKDELYGTTLLDRLGDPAFSSTPKLNGHHAHLNGNSVHHYDERSFNGTKALSFDTSSSSSADSTSTGEGSGIARLTKGVNVSSILEDDDMNTSYKPASPSVLSSLHRPSTTASSDHSPSHYRRLPRPAPSIANTLIHHPRFHFPQGKAVPKSEIDAALRRAGEVFRRLPNAVATYDDMGDIVLAFGMPLYWKKPIWDQVARGRSRVEQKDFSAWWWNLTTVAHDEAARFVHVLSHGGRSFLVEADFHSLVLDLIHTHPGLEFYRKSEEFHEKFIQVIVTRIFWSVNRSWSGRITAAELRKSKLLETIRELERTEDVNQLTEFFSYEHFYVVYCKFWEIDTDHDMEITREDLKKHHDHAILPMVVDRIFSGAVTRGHSTINRPTRDLSAFTAFLLADEDKNHPTSIEYWFRILDLDGDGRISLLEMETFYNELVKVISQFGIDTMTFTDLACNLIDMIEPASGKDFTLSDLKKSKQAGRFFNAFVNWRKFYLQESSEGEKTSVKGSGDEELSDWDRFCMEEYEQMMEQDEDNDENIDDTYSVTLDD